MAKRRKNTNNGFETLIVLFAFILQALIVLVVRLIIFLYDVITFYTSSYRQKSGNGFFKTYFNKGNYGEFILYRKVIRIFGKKSVLANIYLESKNTETTEIDILAVSTKGIYIFEMKNYAGYIYGSDTDQYWTQTFSRRTKHQFYNPLRQNYAHTKAVENYLQLKSGVTIPIVVFSNRSRLSKININQNQRVYQYRNAIKFIKKYEKTNPSLISLDDKENYLVKLIEKCNMTEEVKAKHIQGIKELLANKS